MLNQQLSSSILLQDLAELNSMLALKQLDQYWNRAVVLIHRWTGAHCVRLHWADEEQAETPNVYVTGGMSPALHRYCERWEALNLGASLLLGGDAASQSRIHYSTPDDLNEQDGEITLAQADEMAGFRVQHIDLVVESIPYGILSLVYGPDQSATEEAEGLLALVDMVAANFVRAQALEAARKRVENVSLLYQFNQAVTSLDLNEVLWDAAELVAFLLNAEAASIILADAENDRLTFMVATGEFGKQLIGTHIESDHGVAGWVATHGAPMIVNDPANEKLFTGEIDKKLGFHTENLLCTPLIVRNRTIGVMEVLNREGGFTQQDLDWVLSVSGQISIALENARLYGREHAKVRELAMLNQVSQAITSELDVREVINAITNNVLDLLAVDRSELLLVNQLQQSLDLYSAAGESVGQHWSEQPIPLSSNNLVGWCVREAKPAVVDQVGSDPRCQGMFGEAILASSSLAVVPLINRGNCIGVIVVYSTKGLAFDDERLGLLQTFANQAAVALENATLYADLQDEQERIITIQEEVRHQLARDLHDGPAQMLSSIVLSVDLARRFLRRANPDGVVTELDRLEEIARQANREVRTLLFELRPIILESRGLVAALHAYHRQLSGTISSRVHLEIAAFDETFSPKASNSIFAIVQESVNNIRKHAKAQNIWIRLQISQDNLLFEVEDDGVGFELDRLNKDYAGRNSFGLLNMRERASILGGRLTFYSPRSEGLSGTKILGTVPLAGILGEPDQNFSLF